MVVVEMGGTYRMCLARCSLLVKLRLQGGNSVQKNRWPFFFFEGLFVSLVTLSLSDPSLSSSSPSPISTSRCDATDCVDLCELPRLSSLLVEGVSLSSREGVNGEEGSGRCPASPAKLLRVGVFTKGSSARTSSTAFVSGKNLLFGRGVVGVVSSPPRPDGGSGTVKVVLTAWNEDMVVEMWQQGLDIVLLLVFYWVHSVRPRRRGAEGRRQQRLCSRQSPDAAGGRVRRSQCGRLEQAQAL